MTQKDVDLVIRAKNLSKNTVKQLDDQLGKVADTQRELADANKLAEKSFESLKAEQSQLLSIMTTLQQRMNKLQSFGAQEEALKKLRVELAAARSLFQDLTLKILGTEKPTKELADQLRNADAEVRRLQGSVKNGEAGLSKLGAELKDVGVDTTRFTQSHEQLNASLTQSLQLYTQATSNMGRYESAVSELRAEQTAARASEQKTAQEAKDAASAQAQASRAAIEQSKKELEFAERTAHMYRTLAAAKEKAARAGASFRATGTAALAAANVPVPRNTPQVDTLGASASVKALLDPAREAVSTLAKLEAEVDKLEADFKSLTPEAIKAGDGMEKLADQSRRLREASSALKSQAGLADELSRQNQALIESQRRFEAARLEVIEYAQAVQRADKPNEDLARSLTLAQTKLREARGDLASQVDTFNKIEIKAREAGISVNNLAGAEQRLTATAQRVSASQNQVAATMNRLDQSVDRTNKKFQLLNASKRTSLTLYQRVRGQVLSLASTYVGLFGAIQLANNAVQAGIEKERTMSRLLVVSKGDIAAATAEYDYLRRKADELGLVFGPLADAYSKFAIAAREGGRTLEETRYVFEGFAEASTALRLSAEDTEGVFRALDQIFSKGAIQAEELRGQLGDRMSGAFQLFSKAIGVTTQQLDAMLKKGGLVRAEFVLLAAQQAKSIYGPQAREAADSLFGDMNRLANAWGDFRRRMLEGGFGVELRKLFQDLRGFLQGADGEKFANDVGKLFGALVSAGRDLVGVLAEHADWFGRLVTLVKTLADNAGALLTIFVAIQGVRLVLFFNQLRTAIIGATASAAAMNTVIGTGTVTATTRAGAAISALISGPIGALLAIAATGIVIQVVMQQRIEKARGNIEKDLQSANDIADRLLKRVATLRDENSTSQREWLNDARDGVKVLGQQRDQLKKQLEEYEKRRKAQAATNAAMSAGSAGGMGTGGTYKSNSEEVDKEVKALQSRIKKIDDARNQLAAIATNTSALAIENIGKESKAREEQFKKLRAEAAAGAASLVKDDDKKNDKAKRLAEERVRLEQQAADEIRKVDEDLLKTQEDSLDARTALIRSEIQARRVELQVLVAELEKAGLDETANKIRNSIKLLDELQAKQIASETKEFNSEQVAKNEQKINDILTNRQTQLETVNILQEAGYYSQAEALREIDAINTAMLPELQASVDAARAFVMTLGTSPESVAALAFLDQVQAKITATKTELSGPMKQVIDIFANGIGSAFEKTASLIADVVKGVQSGGDAWRAFGDIVLNTLADILIELGKAILQTVILNALKNAASNSGGGGWGALLSAAASAISRHDGGLVTTTGGMRSLPAFVFENAVRYHNGGIAGLAPNEVPAVLEKNEEVLTEDSPRHRDNFDGAGGAVDLTVINTIDSESVVAAGANTRAGRKSIFNAVKADMSSYKKLFGVK